MNKRKENRKRRESEPVRVGSGMDSITRLIDLAAPAIEAAGNFGRAVRLGIVGGSPDMLGVLPDIVPISRGGKLDHPDAERDWIELVATCVRKRNLDLEDLRQHCRRLEGITDGTS